MAKYLIQAQYSVDGAKGLLKEGGTARQAAVEKLIGSIGGKVESFYYALGKTDLFVIVDAPDNVSAASASLTVNATGAASVTVTVLMSAADMDVATKKSPMYRAPGQ